MRGAHVKHLAHVLDAGRVDAQRLVELRHALALPSRKEGVRCGATCGPGAGGRGPAAAHHEHHARGEGPAVKAGGVEGMRGAHREHVVHVRDAGRVEAQRLVERNSVLPSRKEGV